MNQPQFTTRVSARRTLWRGSPISVHLLEDATLFSYSARSMAAAASRGTSRGVNPNLASPKTRRGATQPGIHTTLASEDVAITSAGLLGRRRTDGRMGPQPRNAPRVTHMLPLHAAPPSTMILRQAMSLRPARPHLAVLAVYVRTCTYEQHGRAAPVGTEPGLRLLCAATRPPRRPPILEAVG